MRMLSIVLLCSALQAQIPTSDARNTEIPNTDTHFTAKTYKTLAEWQTRRAYLRKQILSAAGLLPLRQFDERIGLTKQFAAVLDDRRDPELIEKVFHFYNNAKRPQDARKALEQLRHLRPKDPQLDLYELDLIEVKGLNDIERLLTDIDQILKRYPGDARVEERAVTMVGNVIPLMGNLCDQLTEQMSKVFDQVRHLPNYQINWSAVREVMRDLMKEFQKLRRIVGKCLPLVTSDDHKRIVRDLADHIDKKMEACRSMGAS